jgi:phage recombination protein Bet
MNDKKESKEEKGLVKTLKQKATVVLSKETVRKLLCRNASEAELELFVYQCVMWGLNPFKREIFLVKYSETEPAQTVLAYQSFLKRADRQKGLKGWKAWTEPEATSIPTKACIKIWKEGWDEPFYHEVFYDEYVQKKKMGDGSLVPNKVWTKMPKTMLKKVVTKQGFSLCWPDELGSLPLIQEETAIDIELEPTPIKEEREEKELPPEKEKMKIKKPPQEIEKEAIPAIRKPSTVKKEKENEEPAAKPPDEKTKEEKAAEGYSQKADLVDLIKKYLQEKTIDLKKFKAWLGEIFQPEKEAAHKHFKIVDINEHGAWSLNAGELESLKLCHQHLDFLIEKYIEYDKEKPEQEDIPF